MTARHVVVTWQVIESGGYETAWVDLAGATLAATGRVVGTVPEPYWLAYELDTGPGFVTRRLTVTADTAAGQRELDLRGDGDGWTVNGAPAPELAGARDVDLGRSGLTNSMPILRHGLHTGPGRAEFLVALVSVPDLAVRPATQSYAHLALTGEGAQVRYRSAGLASDLDVDADGLVLSYPGVAHRLA